MLARAQNRRLIQCYQDVQDVQCHQAGRNVAGASCDRERVFGGHPAPAPKMSLYIVNRCATHDVEIPGTSARLRQREGEDEEVVRRLEDVIRLADRRDSTAILEALWSFLIFINQSSRHVQRSLRAVMRRSDRAACRRRTESTCAVTRLPIYLPPAICAAKSASSFFISSNTLVSSSASSQ